MTLEDELYLLTRLAPGRTRTLHIDNTLHTILMIGDNTIGVVVVNHVGYLLGLRRLPVSLSRKELSEHSIDQTSDGESLLSFIDSRWSY